MKSFLPALALFAVSGAAFAAPQSFDCPDAKQAAEITLSTAAGSSPVAAFSVNGQPVDPATLRFVNSQIGDRKVEDVTSTCTDTAMDLAINLAASATRPAGAVNVNAKGTTLKVR